MFIHEQNIGFEVFDPAKHHIVMSVMRFSNEITLVHRKIIAIFQDTIHPQHTVELLTFRNSLIIKQHLIVDILKQFTDQLQKCLFLPGRNHVFILIVLIAGDPASDRKHKMILDKPRDTTLLH